MKKAAFFCVTRKSFMQIQPTKSHMKWNRTEREKGGELTQTDLTLEYD